VRLALVILPLVHRIIVNCTSSRIKWYAQLQSLCLRTLLGHNINTIAQLPLILFDMQCSHSEVALPKLHPSLTYITLCHQQVLNA
jgi:hypothetical protein